MPLPAYDDTLDAPLTSDELVLDRVRDLIGRALARRLWILFLDEHRVQLPLVMPVDDAPAAPAPDAAPAFARMLAELCEITGAASVVLVIERRRDETLTEADRDWASVLHEATETARVDRRGLVLSHRGGVRWIAQDDYRF